MDEKVVFVDQKCIGNLNLLNEVIKFIKEE